MAAPLFLLAPPRSFTSIINAMIGQHPQAFGFPELNLFNSDKFIHLWHPNPKKISFDEKLSHGLLRIISEIYVGEQSDYGIEFAQHWCAVREKHTPAEIFNEIKDKIDPLIPVEKSPAYSIEIECLGRIYQACPDARFIHLTRHPIKQCESSMMLSNAMFPKIVNSVEFQADRAILEPQIAWHDMNINILNFLEQQVSRNQYIHVRGEEIMERPQEKLAEICRWLCIRDDDDAIDEMMHPERSPFACFGPLTALYGNDPNFLRRSKFKQHIPKVPPLESELSWRDDGKGLYKEVLDLAHEFGYK